jgi:hypothetical protein
MVAEGSHERRPPAASEVRGVVLLAGAGECRIAPGNQVDFALLNRGCVSVPKKKMKHIASSLAVKDREIAFGLEDYSTLALAFSNSVSDQSSNKFYGDCHDAK